MEWMVVTGILLLVIMVVISYLVFKNIWNPVTLFCGLYLLILLLYSMHLFDLYYASDTAVTMIVVGTLAFFSGGIFCAGVKGKATPLKKITLNANDADRVRYLFAITLNLLSIIFLIYFAILVIQMLNSGKSMWYIRYIMFSENAESGINSSSLSLFIYSYFVWPWTYVIIPMSVAAFLMKKEKTRQMKVFLITTLVDIALFILVTAGRISIIYYLMYFIIISFILGKRYKLSFRTKILVAVIAVAGIVAINVISQSRKSDKLYINAYVYICGCIPYLSSKIRMFESGSKAFTYGLASFRGIFQLPKVLLYRLTGYEPHIWEILTENCYMQDYLNITPVKEYNAFVTAFYYFYIDGGWIGVVCLSLLYGFIAMYIYIKFMKNPTMKNMMIYLLIVMGLLFSMVRFQFTNASYFLAFIYMALCLMNSKVHFIFGSRKMKERS